MRECFVSFASARDVLNFVEIATKQFFPIRVERDNMQTDATSIMSLFCMGLNRPLRVVIRDPDADLTSFLALVEPYLVA